MVLVWKNISRIRQIDTYKRELEVNCAFSSNNNVRTRFYECCGGHFAFCYFYWNFVSSFFWQPFRIGILNLRIQTSNLRAEKSPLSFCTCKYTDICLSTQQTQTICITTCVQMLYKSVVFAEKWKHIQRAPSKHIDLPHCRPNVVSLLVRLVEVY